MDYKKAGVDIEAGYKSVELMKKYVKETMRPEVSRAPVRNRWCRHQAEAGIFNGQA